MSVMTHYHPQGLTTTKNKNYNHRMQEKYCKTTCNDPIATRNLRQQVAIIHCYPRLPKKCHNNWLSPTTYSMKPILLLWVVFQTNRFQQSTSMRRVQLSIAVTTVWLNVSILLLFAKFAVERLDARLCAESGQLPWLARGRNLCFVLLTIGIWRT